MRRQKNPHPFYRAGRSVKLVRQSPVNPNVGAGLGSENQKSVYGATFGATNQFAPPSASIAHQRAFFGALFQSTSGFPIQTSTVTKEV
jgi:hypothetical protein